MDDREKLTEELEEVTRHTITYEEVQRRCKQAAAQLRKDGERLAFCKSWDKQVRDFLRAICGKPILEKYEKGHTIDECIGVEYRMDKLAKEIDTLKTQLTEAREEIARLNEAADNYCKAALGGDAQVETLKQTVTELRGALEKARKQIRVLLDKMEEQYPKADPVMVTEHLNPMERDLRQSLQHTTNNKEGEECEKCQHAHMVDDDLVDCNNPEQTDDDLRQADATGACNKFKPREETEE